MKRAKLLCLLIAIGVLLSGCTLFTNNEGNLTLTVPESGYPPFEATLTAGGVINGTYTFEVEGKTVTQPQNVLKVTIYNLPCEVTVTWDNGGIPQAVTETIWPKNTGPVIGLPVLNGINDLWTMHPKTRYTVTFPYAYDPEGGPVKLVGVTVYHTGQQAYQAVFCPPYTGPPAIDQMLYRVRTGQGDILNAFVIHSIWEEYLRTGTDGTILPTPPPSKAEEGYPGGRGATCPPLWPRNEVPSGMTIITVTFEDEVGARTTESFEIPTMYYPGC
jgi:hypothetical protein